MMRLNANGRLLLSLGLALALQVGAVLPTAAATVSTLTGETLTGASASGNSGECFSPTYSVSGVATGPYTGTFTETGTWSLSTTSPFNAQFTITSGTTTVTGTKQGVVGRGGVGGILGCGGDILTLVTGVPYTATIHTPDGTFHDEGVSNVTVTMTGTAATLTASFTSSLPAPVPTAPTSKDQCKDGGWQTFPQFKNQGQCVSFVEHPQK